MNETQLYKFYLNESNFAPNDYFYNCIDPRFSTRFQYLFLFGRRISSNKIVEEIFHARKTYSKSSNPIVEMACYVLICFNMEINEYEQNAYRCQNGICISSELWEEGEGDADCLDRSEQVRYPFLY
jgi:hypothetical protein